jgi:tetratricopeptide (TPR) repeat protein
VREAEVGALLEWSARARPLYAPTWLTLAELAQREGRFERADAYAKRSLALWPERPRLVWNVAMLRVAMGDNEGALRTLRAYLGITERTIPQVVLVAERLEPDPRRLVSRLIPDPESPAARVWLSELRELALWKRDAALAREAGAALSSPAPVTWDGEANG